MTHEERKRANDWLSANASLMPPEICRTLRMALMDSDLAAERKEEADSK